MKKLLLLVIPLFMIGCSTDEVLPVRIMDKDEINMPKIDSVVIESLSKEPRTRSGGTMRYTNLSKKDVPANVIGQLTGIPLYLYLGASARYMTEDYGIRIYKKDEPTNRYRRQEWTLESPSGNSAINNYYIKNDNGNYVALYRGNNENPEKIFIKNSERDKNTFSFNKVHGVDASYTITGAYNYGLSENSAGDSYVRYYVPSTVISSKKNWSVKVVEDLRIEDIAFTLETGDRIIPIAVTFKYDSFSYNAPSGGNPVTHTLNLVKTVTESYTHNKSTSFETSVNFSLGVGLQIPIIKDKIGLNVNMTTSITKKETNTEAWGETNTVTKQIGKTLTLPVHPGKSLVAQLVGYNYHANITYIVKYRGTQTGTVYYDTGKFNGTLIEGEVVMYTYVDSPILSMSEIQAILDNNLRAFAK